MTDRPGEATSSDTWVDGAGHRWRYQLTWRAIGGRIECVGVQVTSQDEQPVTAAMLRRLPIGALMAAGRRRQAATARWAAAEPRIPRGPAWRREQLARAREWEREHGGRSGPKGYGPDHFARVASIYAREAMVSNKPTQAIADHFTVSKSAAAKWVARCRMMGLLPPARKGKSG